MEIIKIDDELLASLHSQAVTSERKRMNFDLRTSSEDNSQRMLNILVPGTDVPIHRHKKSNESVVCLSGKLVEIFYEEVFPSIDVPKGMDAQVGSGFWVSAIQFVKPDTASVTMVASVPPAIIASA